MSEKLMTLDEIAARVPICWGPNSNPSSLILSLVEHVRALTSPAGEPLPRCGALSFRVATLGGGSFRYSCGLVAKHEGRHEARAHFRAWTDEDRNPVDLDAPAPVVEPPALVHGRVRAILHGVTNTVMLEPGIGTFDLRSHGDAEFACRRINRALDEREAATYLKAAEAMEEYRAKHPEEQTMRRHTLDVAAGILRGLSAAVRPSHAPVPSEPEAPAPVPARAEARVVFGRVVDAGALGNFVTLDSEQAGHAVRIINAALASAREEGRREGLLEQMRRRVEAADPEVSLRNLAASFAHDECDREDCLSCDVDASSPVESVHPESYARGRREGLEEAARAMCPGCAFNGPDPERHPACECRVRPIRSLIGDKP